MKDLALALAAIVATAITIWACLQSNSDRQSDSRLRIGAVIVFVLVVAFIARVAVGV
jgi:ABC-type phosphate/phosphonate transport system substrate-binding protein